MRARTPPAPVPARKGTLAQAPTPMRVRGLRPRTFRAKRRTQTRTKAELSFGREPADSGLVAVDVASSRADPHVPSAPRAFARVAAVPGWVWVSGIMLASFAGRFLAAASRPAPYYLPDEYIYPSLARSFAEHGRPLIRGAGAHFPALLDPIVTAPVWLFTNDTVTAFRLTQGVHALLFSLAAIPAYLLCRRLGLSLWIAVAVAALTVAVPDGVYSSTMLAEPLAYPLVLAAVYAGVCMVSEPTMGAQLGFAVFSALAVAARGAPGRSNTLLRSR